MPINRKQTIAQIKAHIEEVVRRKEAVIIRNLSYLGELCVNQARSSDEYKDQTGNLRSSIGYVILKDGAVLKKGGFEVVKEGTSGSVGGYEFAKSLISGKRIGYVLIVVAGMKYAEHVEAMGKDVITSAEQLAIQEAPRILKQLI